MSDLKSHRAGAAPGAATSAVVFLHGYGADAADLLGLSQPLGRFMPDTVFLAPDAPEPCRVNPMGYQWFPIPHMDGSTEEAASQSFARSAGLLDAYLDRVLDEEGLTPDRLCLFGFSQGCMMSLHVAPRRAAPIGGIVGVSGRLMVPERLEAETVSKPPVLLVHGDADQVVPFSSMAEAGRALQTAGFDVFGHVMKGTGHGIAPDGLSVALAFLKDKLGID